MLDPFFLAITFAIGAFNKRIDVILYGSLIYAILLGLYLYSGQNEMTLYYDSLMIVLQIMVYLILVFISFLTIRQDKKLGSGGND